MPKRILLIGGPSTGKTTLINQLKDLGHKCLDEVSREVIRHAQEQGIEQLFLKKPLLFSELLRDARIAQYKEVNTCTEEYIFIDRGIPDTVAYMDYIGQTYPKAFNDACKNHPYDVVFILPLWKEIHVRDGERYETFDEAQKIQEYLINTYVQYGYTPIQVPIGPVTDRATFILNTLSS